ncbi:MAG: amidohydrolase [Acidobacteriota bacterium]|nr:MAG: amidohydrolase [Acidobacteriota bacterium]
MSDFVPRQSLKIAAVAALTFLTACSSEAPGGPADWIFTGKAYTLDERGAPVAEAVAVAGDRIVAVGARDEVMRLGDAGTRLVELGPDEALLPGLIDAHGHLLNLGLMLYTVDLSDAASYVELVALVEEYEETLPSGAWVLGYGWDQNRWKEKTFPTHELLSEAVPDRPAWLTRVDGQAGLANRKAMELAGLDDRVPPDPPGGRIVRDPETGSPTGVFVDTAMRFIGHIIPPLRGGEVGQRVLDAVKACVSLGLTSVHEASASPTLLEVLEYLAENGMLPLRVYAMVDGRAGLPEEGLAPPRIGLHDGFLTVRTLKLSLDGALGLRSAALLAPYADDPENKGPLLSLSREDFKAACEHALERGYQAAVHAIGDRANRAALEVYREVLASAENPKELRWRVEHAQVAATEDIPHFARLGLLVSMQPVHATSHMPWAVERLGEARLAGAYAWRKFLDAGCTLAAGSDFPAEPPNPFFGLYAAITRQDREGNPPGGWRPEERLTREEAFRAFTRAAAYAAFEEDLKGALREGMFADLIVVDRDVMEVPPLALREARVLLTMTGGKVRFTVKPEWRP